MGLFFSFRSSAGTLRVFAGFGRFKLRQFSTSRGLRAASATGGALRRRRALGELRGPRLERDEALGTAAEEGHGAPLQGPGRGAVFRFLFFFCFFVFFLFTCISIYVYLAWLCFFFWCVFAIWCCICEACRPHGPFVEEDSS